MKQPTTTHGGQRKNAGRHLKNPDEGKRVKTSFTVSPANLAWLESQEGSRSDTLNKLIEEKRKQ